MITYIYTLTDPRNQEIRYVGKTTNLKARKYNHYQGRAKTHCGNWIRQLLSLGFFPEMKVIDQVDSNNNDDWIELEQYWIQYHKDNGSDLTNLSSGGEGCFGHKHSEEFCKQISERQMGKKLSEETKEKISRAHMGKIISKETKLKLSNIHLGSVHTPEHIEKRRITHLGSKRSPEACENIRNSRIGKPSPWATEAARLANTGRKHTPEHIAKVKLALTGLKRSPETIAIIKDRMRGVKPSQAMIDASRLATKGKPQTPEQIAKRVEATRRTKELKRLTALQSTETTFSTA